MATKNSPRFDLARIYALNVKDIYDLLTANARAIAKRMLKGQKFTAEKLATSAGVRALMVKLNNYSQKYDGVRCVEDGDLVNLAAFVIEEAEEAKEYI